MGMEHYLLGIDPLSRVFLTAFVVVGIPCLMYMLSLRKDAILAAAALSFIGAAVGVVVVRNFLWFLIFWELTVLIACYLMIHDRKPSSFVVAYRYFLVQIIGGASLFFAVGIQYVASGSLALAHPVPQSIPFFLVAFAIKAAVFPFHVWVPLTYPSVPPAIGVLLSAYSTKVGVYAFARLLPGVSWIAYAGAFMALFGVAMALRQTTARRLLSYHLVSQVGYMLVGIGLGTELGIAASTLHMMNNVAYKTLLFMVAGAMIHRVGTDVLKKVGGVGRAMPLTFAAGLVGAAAIAGLPPLNGYVSKTLLKAAAEEHAFLQAAMFVAGIGTALSFAQFIWYLFIHKASPAKPADIRVKEMPFGACLAMGILGVLCVAQGAAYPRFFALAADTASVSIHGIGSVVTGVATVLAGTALFALTRSLARSLSGRAKAGPAAISSASARSKRGRPRAAASQAVEETPPWDVDVIYSWLLHRILRLSQYVACRAKDETQGYLLAIVFLTVALIGFLAW